ncbi:MAG: 30S ribosomal protein S17 [Thaumarchaeota archaeon]|nr:30S ribosomal protein S17 [Nitrososphaerota archaeon]
MSESRSIGLDVKPPGRMCEDPNCPFHGALRIRGKLQTGKVVSVSAKNMAVVQQESTQFNKKYLRYLKKRHKLHAHISPCLDLKIGDTATIAECRPISKTVSFVVVERIAESVVSPSGKK